MNPLSPAKSNGRGVWCMARRQRHSDDSRHYYDWLDKAEDDMIAAEVLAKDDRCYNLCAFHCQQAIEKALKAYLLLSSPYPVDGHNLSWLCKQAARKDKAFTQWLDECATLNGYYTETRYPSDIPEDIGPKEIQSSYGMASDIYHFICLQVDEEMRQRATQSQRDKLRADGQNP